MTNWREDFGPWQERRPFVPPHDKRFYPQPFRPGDLGYNPRIDGPTDEHIRRIVREEIADLLPIDVPDSLPED